MTMPQCQRKGYGRFLIDFSKFIRPDKLKMEHIIVFSVKSIWTDLKFVLDAQKRISLRQVLFLIHTAYILWFRNKICTLIKLKGT